jgi:hypothetical protein
MNNKSLITTITISTISTISTITALLMIAFSTSLWAQSPDNFDNIKEKVQVIMDKQVSAWNKGNIDGFMAGYWKSEKLSFQSGNTRRIGWQTLCNMYKKNYAGEKMGKLEFVDIEMKALTNAHILVLGRWRVTTKKEKKEGLFTLIFKQFGNDWKIIHDHSS